MIRIGMFPRFFSVLLVLGVVGLPFAAEVKQVLGQQFNGSRGPMQGNSGAGGVRFAYDYPVGTTFPMPPVREVPFHSQVDPNTLRLLKASPPTVPGPQHVEDRSSGQTPQIRAPQREAVQPRAPSLMIGFQGIPYTGWIPPDNGTAAGPSHLIQMVNASWQSFTKTGTAASGQVPFCGTGGWWTPVPGLPAGAACFDPKVLYDQNSGRWVMLAVAKSTTPQGAWYLVSTSWTSDPTGQWCVWALDATLDGSTATTNWADYPGLGLDDQAIYIASNQFALPNGPFQYAKLRILGKAQLYSNTCGAVSWRDFWNLMNTDASLAFTVQPAHTFGTPGVEYLVNNRCCTVSSSVTLWSLTNPLGTPPTLTRVNVPVANYSPPPNASQCLIAAAVHTGDARLLDAVFRNGELWTAHNTACGSTSCLRLLRINPTGPTVLDDFSYGASGVSYYYPAVTVDGTGNVHVVFNRSSPTDCVGVHYTGRLWVAPANSLQPSAQLRAGASSYNNLDASGRNRWGDYSGIATDPVNLKQVWIAGEFVASTNVWGVWVGQVKFHVNTAGLYNPAASTFLMRTTNTSGAADIVLNYGPGGAGWIPIRGNWIVGGADTVGLYDPATARFFLRNSNTTGVADIVFNYGPAGLGWIPVVGDWTGLGMKTLGLYDPVTARFFLRNSNTTGVADNVFNYGPANSSWIPLAGDWTGRGVKTVGLYDPATGRFFLRNTNTTGEADIVFNYGPAGLGWLPVVGDWTGQGVDTVGLYDPVTATFYLRTSNTTGVADIVFNYGPGGSSGWIARAGDW